MHPSALARLSILALVVMGCGGKKSRSGTPVPPAASTGSETSTATATAVESKPELTPPAELDKLEGSITLGAHTKVLAPGGLAVSSYDADTGQVSLAGKEGDVAVGDVLAGGVTDQTPFGLLRKVTSVRVEDGRLVAETAPAKLAEAIELGDVELSLALDPAKIQVADVPAGVTIEPPGLVDSSGLVIGVTDLPLSGGFTLTASLELDLGVDFNFQISGFSIDDLSLALTGAQSGTIAVKGAGTTSFAEQIEVGVLTYPPVVVPIGGFPLVIIVSAKLYVGADGKAQAKFVTSATEEAHFRIGFGYEDGELGPIAEGDNTASVQPPILTGTSAEVRGYAGARGEIALYGVAGGYAGLEAFIRLAADSSLDLCRTGSAGIAGRAGVQADIFGFEIAEWSDEFDVVASDLGAGECNVRSGGGSDARLGWIYYPESGTDSLTLRSPLFAPTSDGGLVFARSRNVGVHVAKLDALGEVDWRRGDPESTAESWTRMIVTRDGGYAIAGSTGYGPTLTRLSPLGVVAWSKQYKYSAVQTIRALAEAEDGSLFLGGSIYTSEDVGDDFLLLKVDASGGLLWYRRLKGPHSYDEISDLLIGKDGDLYAAGTYGIDYDTSHADDRTSTLGWAARLDLDGGVVWSTGFTSRRAVAIAEGATGSFVLAGNGEGTTPSLHSEAWAVGLDASGGVRWTQGFAFNSVASGVAAAKDGGALVAGTADFESGARQLSKGFLARLGDGGSVSWSWLYASSGKESAIDFVTERGDGRILAGGHRVPAEATTESWWLSLPADGRGDGELTGVELTAASGGVRNMVMVNRAATWTVEDLAAVVQVEDLGRGLEPEAAPSPETVRVPSP